MVLPNLRGLAADDDKSNIDLIDLTDFDVQIALTENQGVQIYEVLNLVTQFMIESFRTCLPNGGSVAEFDTIILLERARRRQLEEMDRELNEDQTIVGELFTAEFKGATLFSRNATQTPVDPNVVEVCQRQAFLQDDLLLDRLQDSGATGLGNSVVDVRAYINPNSRTQSSGNDGNGDSLEVVIIIAIVIACVAFLFLVFAIYWAWKYDKKNRDAYLASKTGNDERTFDAGDSPESKDVNRASSHTKKTEKDSEEIAPSYPSVVGGDSVVDGVYPESVISEDINSSLAQYYQSGLPQNYTGNGGRLQDAGSVSSMESYGYSLDGYAPSLATPMPADGASTSMQMSAAGDTSVGTAPATEKESDTRKKAEP